MSEVALAERVESTVSLEMVVSVVEVETDMFGECSSCCNSFVTHFL